MKHCSKCQLLFADHIQLCPEDGVALRTVDDIEPGMLIRNKYRILARIGAGGMASVFRARHELLNEDRAIKLVLPQYANDKDFLKRFRHEAAVARRLRHENAVWVEDLDQIEDGRPFIAMELLRGRDLRNLIGKEGPFTIERSLALAGQIASALSAAHELGIIHRDIKPDNVFVTLNKRGTETAKVLDFGIAKALEGTIDGAGYTPTKTGMILGTPQYISPEQAMGRSGNQLDGRADIYSLGVVIYEMLTGRLPFESDTPMGMVLHHLNTKPQPPHKLRPELHIPVPVSLLLMKALEKEPAKRFQTAKELVEALQQPTAWATAKSVAGAALAPTKVVADSGRPPAAPARAVEHEQVPVQQFERFERKPELVSGRSSPKLKRWEPWLAVAFVVLIVIVLGFRLANYISVRKGVETNAGQQSAQPAPIQNSAASTTQPKEQTAPLHNPRSQPEQPRVRGRSARQTPSLLPAIQGGVGALTNTARVAAVRTLLDQANKQRDNGSYRDAINTYNKVLKLDPSNTEAKAGLAKAQQAAEWEFSH
jgi:serine/threonine protein kinase